MREKLNNESDWDKKRNTLEYVSKISPIFHKYLFKYGIISSNDLNDQITLDFTLKEKEFNDGLNVLYRWNLTVIHTILVAVIVWKFYAIWFFIIILLVLIISIIMMLSFTFLVLNLDYLEPVRLRLLKENKKKWN